MTEEDAAPGPAKRLRDESGANASEVVASEDDGFGANMWLVDQMFHRYVEAPDSVSDAWQDFFSDYQSPTAPVPQTQQSAASPTGGPSSPETAREEPQADDKVTLLRGGAATIADRMGESREIPTATSFRTLPAKLLEVNRSILNNQLARLGGGGKVSFTHLIGWAVIKAIGEHPVMNAAYRDVDGKPHRVDHQYVNFGLAMDMARRDGSRTLLVPNIKNADAMRFRDYWLAYEDLVRRARSGRITPDDFAATTTTLTNPGTVGTAQSVPRLMEGQGVIVGVGRIGYPPEYEGADPRSLADTGVGRVLTVSSTYDHRIIQGAESGLFLRRIHEYLLGSDDFYDEIFESMQIPYVPARWATDSNPPPGSQPWAEKQARIFQLINMYRVRGHLISDLDPLRQNPPQIHPELDPLTYGLTIWDLDRDFATGGFAGRQRMQLGKILGRLRDAYCRTVGIEYMHIQNPDQKLWIQQHVEVDPEPITPDGKRRILRKLNEAEAFERFLHTKFLGAKRFSLEGAESLIPLLDTILNAAANAGMADATLGMAHRGRLNVLANTVGKRLTTVFREFASPNATEPDLIESSFSGDVKYHLGEKGLHVAPSGSEIAIEVAANPSHLEAVDPVLEGMVRAKQEVLGGRADDLVLPILIHGDAAFSGQGVVAETLNLSQLRGYYTGGTVHVVVNNQVGFTTSAAEARSSFYATDVAKEIQAPIFHVNGDNPEAVVQVAAMAFAFRQTFNSDVVIDMVCYRRLGHNEGDEPSYTQPRMYALIDQHRSVRKLYMERLVNRGDISLEEGEAVLEDFKAILDAALEEMRDTPAPTERPVFASGDTPVATRAPAAQIRTVIDRLRALPDGFTLHPKLERQLADRYAQFEANTIDWALGEAIALGSLSLDGVPVRLAGEDSRRGTFSHRHAVLADHLTEEDYTPLRNLAPDQAALHIVDSLLSEFAAMGFEYGYSVARPEALVMWEAQFGDFVNGAQVIIDQFLTPGMDKWGQTSGLTLLLPHGFEGQGPEHSSARLERFLTSAAEDNIRVAVPSTPAQLFHLLRRQALHAEKRPLIAISPKSLLRTKTTYSPLEDFTNRDLLKVIPDHDVASGARRVLLCSGKVYYDALRERKTSGIEDVALVRVEQLYPFPAEDINRTLAPYGDTEVVWLQEEPANMGAWRFMSRYLFVEGGRSSRGIYRRESASPATGSPAKHAAEQQALLNVAFQ